MYEKSEIIEMQDNYTKMLLRKKIDESEDFLKSALYELSRNPGKEGVYFAGKLHPVIKEESLEQGYFIREGTFFTYISLYPNCPKRKMVRHYKDMNDR